jgi:RNA-binding protein NOB1
LENLQLIDSRIEASSSEEAVHQTNTINNLHQDSFRNNKFAVGGDDHSLLKDESTVEISMNGTETNDNNDSTIHETSDVQDRQEDEDNDIEWITPDNIDKYQAREQKISVNLKKDNLENVKIACMTTDYSMQVCKLDLELDIFIYLDNLRIGYMFYLYFTRMFCYKCD